MPMGLHVELPMQAEPAFIAWRINPPEARVAGVCRERIDISAVLERVSSREKQLEACVYFTPGNRAEILMLLR
jgi:hypothetical protein